MGGLTGIFRLDADLFASGEPAYMIWQNLMTFANSAMVILLLIIIVSQLTGYGIDNYGIKKMLPKLIVAAILVNLSFLICQIAVDLSNIIGSGIIGFMKDAYANLTAETGGGRITIAALFNVIFLGGTAVGSLAIAAVTAPIWWIPLLLVALVGLISFIMFWLLLAARQLLAVVLVAVSPLAMICYAMPNTQKLFNRWMSMFQAVLIIYPICAALYGASLIMQAVAYKSSEVHIVIVMVALLASFLPLIVAPTLIKKALASLGSIGGMISGLGDKMKGGVKQGANAFSGSERGKEMARRQMMRRADKNIKAYNAVQAGTANRRQRIRSWVAGGERGFVRNTASLERASAEDTETTRAAMRDETGNYNVDIMGAQLEKLLDTANDRELTTSERNKVKALALELSNQQGGAKMLNTVMAGKNGAGRTGRAAQIMGEYMAQNGKVRTTMSEKSQRTSQRLADIAAGAIDADTTQAQYDNMNNAYLKYRRERQAEAKARGESATFMSQADWIAHERAAGNTVDNTTVVENIARNVLDKDKMFVTQSGSEVEELLNHIDQARIDRMAANPNLFSYGDVAEGTELMIRGRATGSKPIQSQPVEEQSGVDFWIDEITKNENEYKAKQKSG